MLLCFPKTSVKQNKQLILSAPSLELCTRGSNSHQNILHDILCRSSLSIITVSPSWLFCEYIEFTPPAHGYSLRNSNKCRVYGTANSDFSIFSLITFNSVPAKFPHRWKGVNFLLQHFPFFYSDWNKFYFTNHCCIVSYSFTPSLICGCFTFDCWWCYWFIWLRQCWIAPEKSPKV